MNDHQENRNSTNETEMDRAWAFILERLREAEKERNNLHARLEEIVYALGLDLLTSAQQDIIKAINVSKEPLDLIEAINMHDPFDDLGKGDPLVDGSAVRPRLMEIVGTLKEYHNPPYNLIAEAIKLLALRIDYKG